MVKEIFCQVLLFFLVAIFPFFLPQLTFASAPHPAEPQSKQEASLVTELNILPTFRAIISAVHSAGVISLRALACLTGFLNGFWLSSYVLSQIN